MSDSDFDMEEVGIGVGPSNTFSSTAHTPLNTTHHPSVPGGFILDSSPLPSASESEPSSDEDDEGMDWEEVDVPDFTTAGAGAAPAPAPAPGESVEEAAGKNKVAAREREALKITLEKGKGKAKEEGSVKKKGLSQLERTIRLETHKLHVCALIANARARNKLINDPLLHARMLSKLPLMIQQPFSALSPTLVPDPVERSRRFDNALKRLLAWWIDHFRIDPTLHALRTRSFQDVEEEMARARKGKGKGRARDSEDEDDEDSEPKEVIRSTRSMQKRALQMRGSRDMSAQLFTALCRALGIPARLVVSLQAVPWRASSSSSSSSITSTAASGKGKANGKGKGKGKKPIRTMQDELEEEGDEDDANFELVEEAPPPFVEEAPPPLTWAQRQERAQWGDGQCLAGSARSSAAGSPPASAAPTVRLRKQRAAKQTASSSSRSVPDPSSPPVFWTEVFSRPDGKWLVVDPLRNKIRNSARAGMEPPSSDKSNRMTYVLAFEEDGFAKDVTVRYAKHFGARTSKLRPPVRKDVDWWAIVVQHLTRHYRLARDDTEDAELMTSQISERMPTSQQGFKDHPLYVLERHLKREEIVHPRTEIGKFRGEPVFPRANVVALKTPENWLRVGRQLRKGQHALKEVKQRAVTLARRRAQEAQVAEGGGDVLQGLYARWQTEEYRARPVVDGKVPKNNFGNIDLYVPSMLPEGGVHLPQKGIAKIAKMLGIDYAEAVTGFEFRQRRANPVMTGIVIPAESKDAVLDAYEEWASVQAEKEAAKLQERVLKRWQRLVQGLRIRQRLQEEYDRKDGKGAAPDAEQPFESAAEHAQFARHEAEGAEGGFLIPGRVDVRPTTAVDEEEEDGVERYANGNGLALEDDEALEAVPTPTSTATPTSVPRGAPQALAAFAELQAEAAASRTSNSDAAPSSDSHVEIIPSPAKRPRRSANTAAASAPKAKAAPKPKPKPTPRARARAPAAPAPAPERRVTRSRAAEQSAEQAEKRRKQEAAVRRALAAESEGEGDEDEESELSEV